MIAHLLIAIGVVFGVNLLPAFGPPTWAVLVYFRFRYVDVPVVGLILGGALAAAAGRFLLALAFRAFGRWLPAKRRESLEALGRTLGQSRGGLISSFIFFAAAPVPSAQMFEAAGLARIRLTPLVGAFFGGRLVSYSLYVEAAGAAHKSIAKLFRQGFTSPQAITTQLIAVAALIAIVKIDWPTTIDKVRAWCAARRGRPCGSNSPSPTATNWKSRRRPARPFRARRDGRRLRRLPGAKLERTLLPWAGWIGALRRSLREAAHRWAAGSTSTTT